MVANNGGAIVNIASILGLVAIPNAPAYNSSKGGLVLFTKSIAVEYAKDNIRANSICPGLVTTPMTEELMAQKDVIKEIKKDLIIYLLVMISRINVLNITLAFILNFMRIPRY